MLGVASYDGQIVALGLRGGQDGPRTWGGDVVCCNVGDLLIRAGGLCRLEKVWTVSV